MSRDSSFALLQSIVGFSLVFCQLNISVAADSYTMPLEGDKDNKWIGNTHNGHTDKDCYAIDLTLAGCDAEGEKVFSVTAGTIHAVVSDKSCKNDDYYTTTAENADYGNYIVICNDEHCFLYAHLCNVSENPEKSKLYKKGDKVEQGAQIGTVGHTGYTDGSTCTTYEGKNPHLHFSIRTSDNKTAEKLFDLSSILSNDDKVTEVNNRTCNSSSNSSSSNMFSASFTDSESIEYGSVTISNSDAGCVTKGTKENADAGALYFEIPKGTSYTKTWKLKNKGATLKSSYTYQATDSENVQLQGTIVTLKCNAGTESCEFSKDQEFNIEVSGMKSPENIGNDREYITLKVREDNNSNFQKIITVTSDLKVVESSSSSSTCMKTTGTGDTTEITNTGSTTTSTDATMTGTGDPADTVKMTNPCIDNSESACCVNFCQNPFNDVTKDRNAEFCLAIQCLKEQKIIEGYTTSAPNGCTAGNFCPEKTINRSEFTKIVIGAKFSSDEISKSICEDSNLPFKDVENVWYCPYVQIAKNNGIVGGYDGSFKPNNPINLAEAIKIIRQALFAKTMDSKPKNDPLWWVVYVDGAGDGVEHDETMKNCSMDAFIDPKITNPEERQKEFPLDNTNKHIAKFLTRGQMAMLISCAMSEETTK